MYRTVGILRYTLATTAPYSQYNAQRQPNTTLEKYGLRGSYLTDNLPAPVDAILNMHKRLEKIDIYAPPNLELTNAPRTTGAPGKPKMRKARTSTQTNDSDTDEDDSDDITQLAGQRKKKTQHSHDDDIFYGEAQRQYNPCLLYTSPSPRD